MSAQTWCTCAYTDLHGNKPHSLLSARVCVCVSVRGRERESACVCERVGGGREVAVNIFSIGGEESL